MMRRLEGWHSSLPEGVQLSSLVNNHAAGATASQRRALLLTHLMYLGGVVSLHWQSIFTVAQSWTMQPQTFGPVHPWKTLIPTCLAWALRVHLQQLSTC